MRRFGVMVCVSVAALCAVAEARDTTLKHGEFGLADVVRRECRTVWWLSAAMKESRLVEADLKVLKTGALIVVPDACATEMPPREVRRSTQRIFKHQQELRDAKEQVAAIGGMNQALQKEVEEKIDAATLATMRAEKTEKGNEALRKQLAQAGKPGDLWAGITVGTIVGIGLAFAGIWFFWIRRLRGEKLALAAECRQAEDTSASLEARLYIVSGARQQLEEQLKALGQKFRELQDALNGVAPPGTLELAFATHFHGDLIRFDNTSLAGCRLCGMRGIPPTIYDLRRHLADFHIELRVIEITPAEARRLLARSICPIIRVAPRARSR